MLCVADVDGVTTHHAALRANQLVQATVCVQRPVKFCFVVSVFSEAVTGQVKQQEQRWLQ